MLFVGRVLFTLNLILLQEEVDNSIYSKMADDLETANKRIKKKKSSKLAQKQGGITA